MKESIYLFISNKANEITQLKHASNIIAKEHSSTLTDKQTIALDSISEKYYTYLHENLQLHGYSKETIARRVSFLNSYYNFFYQNKYDNIFTSQGKFRSTILEEFMFLLFRDYINDLKNQYSDYHNVINSGSAKAYTNLYFTATGIKQFIESPEIGINVKDQDFSIYRDFEFKINSNSKKIKIPIIAIENKTYIDKTMLEGMIATAEKIKTGNPYAMYIGVTENYDVDLNVDPAYSRIDQIYVLRKSKRKEAWNNIDVNVVLKLFNDIKGHIERPWSNIENKMRTTGTII